MKIKEKKEDLLANIIYDLKTPTNAQITALESFLKTSGKKINSEEKDLIELTLNSCLHVQKLIDNFSSAYRLNFENLKLNYEKFDIANMINTIIKEVSPLPVSSFQMPPASLTPPSTRSRGSAAG